MANGNSLISHPQRYPMSLLRMEYIAIITARLDELEDTYSKKQVRCAAKLLAVFEYWSNWKLDKEEVDAIMEEAMPEQAYLDELDPTPAGEGYGPWIWKAIRSTTKPEQALVWDLMGEHKYAAIRAGLDILIALDYLAARHNPDYGYDRTWQYAVHTARIQEDLDRLPPFKIYRAAIVQKSTMDNLKIDHATSKNRQSIVQKSTMDNPKIDHAMSKNRPAIPESTTESTTESTRESTTEQAPAPAQEPTPSPASPAASAVDDDVNPELAKCLLKFGITKNAKTAPIFASDTLTPADVERVFAEAQKKAKGGTVKNVSGLAVHLLLNYQPAPRTLKEHPLRHGYNGRKGETLICDRCGAEYEIKSNCYHMASELVCDCGGFLDIVRTAELETAS